MESATTSSTATGVDDQIYGEEKNDVVIPGPGDDYALGSAGRDIIYGYGIKHGVIVHDGIDTIDGGHTQDLVIAGGADIVLGGSENDILRTATMDIAPAVDGRRLPGRMILIGSEVADEMLFGDVGDDRILGKAATISSMAASPTTASRRARQRPRTRGRRQRRDLWRGRK